MTRCFKCFPALISLVVVNLLTLSSYAQFFNFDYSGPDTLFVGTDCTAVLDWGGDAAIIASCTSTPCTVADLSLDMISGGYQQGDLISPNNLILISYIAEDNFGNQGYYNFDLLVIDTTPPTLSNLQTPITIQCDELLTFPQPIATDNCDPNPDLQSSDIFSAGSCSNEYTLTRTWWATDQSGNISQTFNQTINVVDQNAPIFSVPANDRQVSCMDEASLNAEFGNWISANGNAVAVDNCTPLNALTWFAAVPGSYDLADANTFPGTFPGTLDLATCPSAISSIFRSEIVDFIVEDECGNVAVSSATFSVVDVEQPNIIDCPLDMILQDSDSDCMESLIFNLPNFSDNCDIAGFQFSYQVNENALISPPNSQPFTIQFSEAYNEVNYYLTDCAGNKDTCTFFVTIEDMINPVINCPVDEELYLDASDDCQLGLEYNLPALVFINDNCPFVTPFTVEYFVTGSTNITAASFLSNNTPTVNLSVGTSEVFYVFNDASGNPDTCNFEVQVIDTIAPQLSCQNFDIILNPSETAIQVLNPNDFILSSSDNCGATSISISPGSIDCSQGGNNIPVTISVSDTSGNQRDCISILSIDIERPNPSFNQGLCEGEDITLFSNPPTDLGSGYTYQWSGPNSFQSNLPNPVISNGNPNDNGIYTVEITGQNSCTASATVDIIVEPKPSQPNLVSSSLTYCTGDSIFLNTNFSQNNNTSFHWYEGSYPSGQLLATTPENNLALVPYSIQVSKNYYLIVEVNSCLSDPSTELTIEVYDAPIATVNDEVLTVCQSSSFTLGTNTTGLNFTYEWTGPAGFNSIEANPPTLNNVDFINAGTYELIVYNNGCPSVPNGTTLFIDSLPDTPEITTGATACLGQDIVLITTELTAENYYWTGPNVAGILTSQPELNFTNVSALDSGAWTLVIEKDGCFSASSLPVQVLVESPFDLMVSNDGPACENGSAELSALTLTGASYIWTGPDGFSSNDPSPTITPPVEGLYELSVITSVGCVNTGNTLLETAITPTITAIANSAQPCMDSQQDLILSATVFPIDNGNFTYNWIGPDGLFSNNPSPLIQDLDDFTQGAYTLTVSNGSSCASMPSTTSVAFNISPEIPAFDLPETVCEGEAINLITTEVVGTTVEYHWSLPTGPIETTDPFLTIPSADLNYSGMYTLAIEQNDCLSENAVLENLLVNPTPPQAIVTSNSPVCEGATIELSANANPEDAVFIWTGVNGFISNQENASISNAAESASGAYFLQLELDGCFSPISVAEDVEVIERPSSPVAIADTELCLDSNNPQLVLSIEMGSHIENAVYYWYDENNVLVAGPTFEIEVLLTNIQGYGPGVHQFNVQSSLSDCLSDFSNNVQVDFQNIPNEVAIAGADIATCDIDNLQLNAEEPQGSFGTWVQTSGPLAIIENPNDPNSNITGLEQGNEYTFAWTLSTTACENFATDEVMVVIDNLSEIAEAGITQTLCDQNTVQLAAAIPLNSTIGEWTQEVAQALLGVVIENPNDPNTFITGLDPGEIYSFSWTLSNSGCGAFSTDNVEVNIIENENEAFAGIDFEYCGQGNLQLLADDPASGIGQWTVDNSSLSFEDQNEATTFVSGLNENSYLFVWEVDNGICGISKDSVNVDYFLGPQATNDFYTIPFAGKMNLKVVENDNADESFFVSITKVPDHGELVVLGDGEFEFKADINYSGIDSFEYNLCYFDCLEGCAEARVLLTIGEEANECRLPTIFSPNGDGVNDALVIPCLASGNFQNNSINIFNQWGDEVFKAQPYQNDWEGLYKGEQLPVGTYYYILELEDGKEPLSNFLQLER